jgi:hypothetical protein
MHMPYSILLAISLEKQASAIMFVCVCLTLITFEPLTDFHVATSGTRKVKVSHYMPWRHMGGEEV